MKAKIFFFFFFLSINLVAQPPDNHLAELEKMLGYKLTPEMPKPTTLGTGVQIGFLNANSFNQSANPYNPYSHQTPQHIQKLNAEMHQEYLEYEKKRQLQRQRLIYDPMIEEALRDLGKITQRKNTDLSKLPPLNEIYNTGDYAKSYKVLVDMLERKEPVSLKKAVYAVENAYYQNTLPENKFDEFVAHAVKVIKYAILQTGNDFENIQTRKVFLHQFMSGRIDLYNENGEVAFSKSPYKYDFDDPIGKKDHTKMFVSKLIDKGNGQCHSMPLLYLMIAEALDIEAWLSFSPNHSFIKLQDDKKKWYNLELTSGHYVHDNFLMHKYTSAQGVKTKIYLDTLSQKELIAYVLMDLANGYKQKFGYDEFNLKCAETAIKYHPENIMAWSEKSNYYTRWTMYVCHSLNIDSPQKLMKHPFALDLEKQRVGLYNRLDLMGYSPMALPEYEKWLQTYNEHKIKPITP